jgi:hypothetical protein
MQYRKLFTHLWQHADFRAMDALGKIVAMYLLTGPQTNRIGLFRLSKSQMVIDIDIDEEIVDNPHGNVQPALRASMQERFFSDVTTRFTQCCSVFDWRYDGRTRMLYIPSWWRWNTPENANVMKWALRDLDDLPQNPFISSFADNTVDIPQHSRAVFDERMRVLLSHRSARMADNLRVVGARLATGMIAPLTSQAAVAAIEEANRRDAAAAIERFTERSENVPGETPAERSENVSETSRETVTVAVTDQEQIIEERIGVVGERNGTESPTRAPRARRRRTTAETGVHATGHEPSTLATPVTRVTETHNTDGTTTLTFHADAAITAPAPALTRSGRPSRARHPELEREAETFRDGFRSMFSRYRHAPYDFDRADVERSRQIVRRFGVAHAIEMARLMLVSTENFMIVNSSRDLATFWRHRNLLLPAAIRNVGPLPALPGNTRRDTIVANVAASQNSADELQTAMDSALGELDE